MDNMLYTYNQIQNGEIIAVLSEHVKTNSTYGNWAVQVSIKIPIGTGETTKYKFFMRKKDAIKWIRKELERQKQRRIKAIKDLKEEYKKLERS